METKYDKYEINSEISMGEVLLIQDEKIIDKDSMNKIITGTILELHLKKHIKFTKNKKGKIVIQIQNSKEALKKTEKLILKCLKESNIEKDTELQLEEITTPNNPVFYKNKKQLKDFIIEESIEDGYIDKEKLELKNQYFNQMVVMIMFGFLTFVFSSLIRFSRYIMLICNFKGEENSNTLINWYDK